MSTLRHLAACFVGISTVASAQAQTGFQDLDALDAMIAASLGAATGEPGGAAQPLDRRLRLAICREPITVAPIRQGASIVRCGDSGWRFHLAIAPAIAVAPTPVDGRPFSGATPAAIVRGDELRAVLVGRGFSISTAAIAEEDGAIGQRIRIRIDGRSHSSYAVVVSQGNVQL